MPRNWREATHELAAGYNGDQDSDGTSISKQSNACDTGSKCTSTAKFDTGGGIERRKNMQAFNRSSWFCEKKKSTSSLIENK